MNTPHFYIENDLSKKDYDGFALPLIRVAVVDSQLSGADYAIALTHELVHIKYQTGNETWTSFKTFVVLYESKSIILQNVALYYAQQQLSGMYIDDYDCSYYIAEYLNLI